MASTVTLYNELKRYLADGTIDLDSDSFKVALLTSSYVPNYTAHTKFADVSATEAANGSGYTTGGVSISNLGLTMTGTTLKWLLGNPTWVGLTKTFRYAVVYKVGTANSIVNPLVCAVLLDNTPADIAVSSIDYSFVWAAGGVLTLS